MTPVRRPVSLILAGLVACMAGAGNGWARDGATLAGLPEAFSRRPAELIVDPDDSPVEHRAVTEIWVRAEQPGRLELLDGAGRVLALDRGPQPAILYDWSHAIEEPVPDIPFILQFLPDRAAAGTRRILRVRAGASVHLALLPPSAGESWRLQSTEPNTFAPPRPSLDRLTVDESGLTDDPEVLESEMMALLALEDDDAPGATAAQLRAQGLQRIVEGDYATALELLEHSLDLEHDEALADRVERLRLFFRVRPGADEKPERQSPERAPDMPVR